jgi:hypothetical protein
MKYTDHPKIHRLRGSISGGSGFQVAQRLDPPILVPADAPEKVLACGPGYNQPDPSYYHPKPTHQSNPIDLLNRNVNVKQLLQSHRSTDEPISQHDDAHEDSSQSRLERKRSEPKANPIVTEHTGSDVDSNAVKKSEQGEPR